MRVLLVGASDVRRCGIDYRSVDLDSVEFQKDDWGGEDPRALDRAYCAVTTVPQIFVGDRFVGGCTEIFDAYNDGSLQQMLESGKVPYDREVRIDPYSFLPSWLHPR